jgi:predicted transcriptional regulator
MGRLPGENRQYTLQEIQDSHREIARLLVTGAKHVDIADMLGVTPAMVSYTANSPVVKRELDNMRAARDLDTVDIAKRIQEVAPRALQVMEDLLEEANDAIKLKIATDLLDRAGHTAIRTIRTENLHAHLNRDDIEEIKQRARGMGLLVDIPQVCGA